MAEKDETKYLVLKWDDIKCYLSWNDQCMFQKFVEHINECRRQAGKSVNQYIICNQDEPYAEQVWRAILKGEESK